MKGIITSQKTVWCGKCGGWDYIDNTKYARNIGWKFTTKDGWVCKMCLCKHENTTEKDRNGLCLCRDCKKYIKE